MSAIPRHLYTEEEYLVLERQAVYRSEYYRGEIFAMAGSSSEHNLMAGNLKTYLHRQLRQRGCRMYLLEMRLKVAASGLYTYPDAMIVCGTTRYADDHVDTVLNPAVVFEILSDSTEAFDRGKKFDHYRRIPTLQEYVLISQEKPLVERFLRETDMDWKLQVIEGLDATLALSSVDASITLAEIYEDIEFPALE